MEVSRGLLEGEDAAIAGAPGAHLLLVGGAPLLGLGRVVEGGAVVTTEIAPVTLLGKTPAIESSGLSEHIHYTRLRWTHQFNYFYRLHRHRSAGSPGQCGSRGCRHWR